MGTNGVRARLEHVVRLLQHGSCTQLSLPRVSLAPHLHLNKAESLDAGAGGVCQKVTTEQGGGGVYGSGAVYTRTCGTASASSGSTCGPGCLGYAFVGNNNPSFTIAVRGHAHYQ
jgi:hypothetical protein